MSAAVKELQKRRAFLASAVEDRNRTLAELEADIVAQRDLIKEWISKDSADIADIDGALKTLGVNE